MLLVTLLPFFENRNFCKRIVTPWPPLPRSLHQRNFLTELFLQGRPDKLFNQPLK